MLRLSSGGVVLSLAYGRRGLYLAIGGVYVVLDVQDQGRVWLLFPVLREDGLVLICGE